MAWWKIAVIGCSKASMIAWKCFFFIIQFKDFTICNLIWPEQLWNSIIKEAKMINSEITKLISKEQSQAEHQHVFVSAPKPPSGLEKSFSIWAFISKQSRAERSWHDLHQKGIEPRVRPFFNCLLKTVQPFIYSRFRLENVIASVRTSDKNVQWFLAQGNNMLFVPQIVLIKT